MHGSIPCTLRPHEPVDIAELNAEIKTTVSKVNKLRAETDAIVAEIEGWVNE
jgi:hypothetical protein